MNLKTLIKEANEEASESAGDIDCLIDLVLPAHIEKACKTMAKDAPRRHKKIKYPF